MRRLLPPLNALKAFEASARHLSFSLAAEELSVTPGAVSRHVKTLEEFFNTKLFDRHHQSISLTDEGRRIFPPASSALDQLEDLARDLLEARSELRVKVLTTIGVRWLIPRLHRFKKLYPEVRIRLTTEVEPADLALESYDAAIIYGEPATKDIVKDLIFVEQATVVCDPELLPDRKPLRSAQELKNYPLILNTPDGWDWRLWAKAKRVPDLPIDQGIPFETDETAIQACLGKLGIALTDLRFVEREIKNGQLIEVLVEEPYPVGAYYLISLTKRKNRAGLAAFRDWLIAESGGGAIKPYARQD
ncbi:MAG: LysR substrate-binding domain-containing protein [Pseudomonadota bacterium]